MNAKIERLTRAAKEASWSGDPRPQRDLQEAVAGERRALDSRWFGVPA